MIKKIENVFLVIIIVYSLFFSYLVLINNNVQLNEFSVKIGLTQKYKYKVMGVEDSQKFDNLVQEAMNKGNVSDEKLKELKKKVEDENNKYKYGYRRNYLVYLIYLVVGIFVLKRIEHYICVEYNKQQIKKGIKI